MASIPQIIRERARILLRQGIRVPPTDFGEGLGLPREPIPEQLQPLNPTGEDWSLPAPPESIRQAQNDIDAVQARLARLRQEYRELRQEREETNIPYRRTGGARYPIGFNESAQLAPAAEQRWLLNRLTEATVQGTATRAELERLLDLYHNRAYSLLERYRTPQEQVELELFAAELFGPRPPRQGPTVAHQIERMIVRYRSESLDLASRARAANIPFDPYFEAVFNTRGPLINQGGGLNRLVVRGMLEGHIPNPYLPPPPRPTLLLPGSAGYANIPRGTTTPIPIAQFTEEYRRGLAASMLAQGINRQLGRDPGARIGPLAMTAFLAKTYGPTVTRMAVNATRSAVSNTVALARNAGLRLIAAAPPAILPFTGPVLGMVPNIHREEAIEMIYETAASFVRPYGPGSFWYLGTQAERDLINPLAANLRDFPGSRPSSPTGGYGRGNPSFSRISGRTKPHT